MIDRLSDAWAALCGRPRVVKETVYVPGPASLVEVFMGKEYAGYPSVGRVSRYYATCSQAHTECRGEIVKVRLMKFADGELYRIPDDAYLLPVRLEPKPKRAKGAKA